MKSKKTKNFDNYSKLLSEIYGRPVEVYMLKSHGLHPLKVKYAYFKVIGTRLKKKVKFDLFDPDYNDWP